MRYFFVFGLLSIMLISCLDNTPPKTEKKENTKTNVEVDTTPKDKRTIRNAGSNAQYTGKPGQLILVVDNTEYTQEIEELFDSIFAEPIRPYYPPTPYFEVYQRSPQDFMRLSTKFRNVIDLSLDESIEKGNPSMRIYENYYSRTQLYTILKANDMQDLYELLSEEIGYLFTIYNRQEWKREFLRNSKFNNESTREKLKTKFGIDLVLPGKFRYESIDNNYAHIILPERSRPMDLNIGSGNISRVNYVQSGIQIWQYPYTNKEQLNPENLLQMRDTILKKYAKHEMEGVYMGTQYHPAALPVHEYLKVGDIEGYQFRGLYKFTGEAEPGGGRYWEFHFKHPYKNNIVVVSGYIDVPPTMSPSLDINIIRAVIYSLKAVE